MTREVNGDTSTVPRKVHAQAMKQSHSHGNLVDNRFYMSDDNDLLSKENRKLVKRTKSFWKFGKNSSDNEILEGMALWRHRDLVDVENEKKNAKKNSQRRVRKPSRDKSNDSDRTINAKQNGDIAPPKIEKNTKTIDVKRNKSFAEKQKLSLPKRRNSDIINEDFDNYEKHMQSNKIDDQFYDDDGDGLMMKTVNRKNILQQYSNDSSGADSGSESDITSDDPYDCIVVDDQQVRNENKFPNVAELGKKLEKLSKSSKYSPNKENNMNNQQIRNSIQEKNNINMRSNIDKKLNSEIENEDIIQYRDKRHSFKTFGIETNNENGEKERIDNERYYSQAHSKKNNETAQDKRRYYADSNNKINSGERHKRPSYESIENEVQTRSRDSRSHQSMRRSNEGEKRDKMKYYDSTNDELSDAVENRQFLPRTKLTKTNSNNSKYEQDIGLMEYGETLQKRLKNPEYGAKYDERSPHNGNMYGPWYDLWGLDSSVRK